MQVNEEQNIAGTVEDRKTKQGLRLLDAEVAERVMGWVRVTGKTALAPFAYKRPDGHIVHPYSAPCYSSSIEAAMQVVEKMRERGWDAHASTIALKNWYCEFIKVNANAAEFHKEESDSLPEAICRAALALVNKPDTNSANSDHPARGQASETEVQQ